MPSRNVEVVNRVAVAVVVHPHPRRRHGAEAEADAPLDTLGARLHAHFHDALATGVS